MVKRRTKNLVKLKIVRKENVEQEYMSAKKLQTKTLSQFVYIILVTEKFEKKRKTFYLNLNCD